MRAKSDRSAKGPRQPRTKKAARAPEPIIAVRRSSIQGRGVFALRDIKRGERIVEYVGERITHAEATVRYDDESAKRHHTFLFSLDDKWCVDGAHDGNDARFINHSCDPNAYALIDRRRIFIVAKKRIQAGEEILYDYFYSVDPGYSLDDLKRLYPCRCGSPKCRGTLAGVKKPRPRKPKVTEAPPPVAEPIEAPVATAEDAALSAE